MIYRQVILGHSNAPAEESLEPPVAQIKQFSDAARIEELLSLEDIVVSSIIRSTSMLSVVQCRLLLDTRSESTHGRCCMIHGHCVGWVDRQVTCKSKRRLCNIIGCACVSATSDLVHYSSCDETRVDVPTYITCMQRHHEHDSDSAIECTDRRS